MKLNAHPACIERLRQQVRVLLCVFLLQFAFESLGAAVRTATPFDDICRASTARGGDPSGTSGGMPSHGEHCALCVSAGAVLPPSLPFALTDSGHADAPPARGADSQHRIGTGAHWQSRAPPLLS